MTKAKTEILKKNDSINLDWNFVAIGSTIDFGHAAIIIKYEDKIHEFDFVPLDGIQSSQTTYSNSYKGYSDYYKLISSVNPVFIPTLIAQCMNIKKKANPSFGYFYSGESYDLNGNHLSNNTSGEQMTCVGFCLNVLKGFFEKDYLVYTDWDSSSVPNEYVENYCKKYSLEVSSISSFARRISPEECLFSGFFEELPISKKNIDTKIKELKPSLKKRGIIL